MGLMRDYVSLTQRYGERLALLATLLSPSVAGCTTMMAAQAGIPATDQSAIAVGASRESVESALGAPIARTANATTYEYNRGWQHPNVKTAGDPGNVALGAAVDMFTLGIVGARYYAQQHQAQRARITILYSPDDKVTSVDLEASRRHFETWMLSNDRTTSLSELCLAANGGYAPALYEEALRHRYGLWGTKPDLIEAVLWIKLAEFAGHSEAAGTMANWSTELSKSDRDLVESRFRTWAPNSCAN